MDNPTLAYGHRRLVPDENTIAGYGARLIYDEVKQGSQGVVWDRQDTFGGKELVEKNLFPAMKMWYHQVKDWMSLHWNGSASDDVIEYKEGVEVDINGEYILCDVIIKGSPQSSYGYLYVTALLNKRVSP